MENINGYVIYPASIGEMDLNEAMLRAASESTMPGNEYQSRIEDCDTNRVVAQFRNGQEV